MSIPDINNLGEAFRGAAVIILIMGLLSAVLGVILIISCMKIFKKAGKNMWYALIPIYNIIVMMDIIKMKYIELLYILIPIVGPIIFSYKYSSNLAKSFGKSSGFALGLFFLSFIFVPLLAFSDDKYIFAGVVNEAVNNVVFNPVGTSNANNDQLLINNSQELVMAITSDNVIENVVEPIENLNVDNTASSVVESAPVEPLQMENTVVENTSIPVEETHNETVPFESLNIDNNPMPQVESNLETINVQANEPVLESIPEVTPTENSVIDNVIPVVPLETEQEETTAEENIIPIVPMEPVANENIINTISDTQVELPSKNVCKKCGIEMPNIVTICPNCGNDNE